ncbi:MAG: hypothetical protein KGO50_18670, partial [Myxococcales bacterium]|nr:hypothetical protein [Myxococcales bacterium]
ISASVGLKFTDVRWNKETIKRDGVEREYEVLHLPDDFDLTAKRSAALFATWTTLDPENDYLRIVAGRTIALWEPEEHDGLLFDRDTGDEAAIDLEATEQPPWLDRLDELADLLAA